MLIVGIVDRVFGHALPGELALGCMPFVPIALGNSANMFN